MKGIIDENLNALIKKNNLNSSTLSNDLKLLVNSIAELEDSYSGSSIDFVFLEAATQKDNLNKISKLVNNYSDVLSTVKLAYDRQDEYFHDILKNTDL